jgi:hypothetical protein
LLGTRETPLKDIDIKTVLKSLGTQDAEKLRKRYSRRKCRIAYIEKVASWFPESMSDTDKRMKSVEVLDSIRVSKSISMDSFTSGTNARTILNHAVAEVNERYHYRVSELAEDFKL